MVKPSDRLRLALESLQSPGVEIDLVDDLEGDVAPERFLERLVDDPHSASAQLADDPELAEPHGSARRRLRHVGDERPPRRAAPSWRRPAAACGSWLACSG